MTQPARARDTTSLATLLEANYAVLRRIAARGIRNATRPDPVSPTSLVAECMVRLLQQRVQPVSESHLRGLTAIFVARVLTDQARARMRRKRGSGSAVRSLDDPSVNAAVEALASADQSSAACEAAHSSERFAMLDAMERLSESMPRQMEVVTLHLVADIPIARVATLVGVSERTAYRNLEEGRAALAQALRNTPPTARP